MYAHVLYFVVLFLLSPELGGLWYGMIVAIPSGMGVALSLLDQNTGGLVGVAISASLLPPAVAAGEFKRCKV